MNAATVAMFHRHLVAAYTVVWVVQVGYLAYVVRKWLAARRVEREMNAKSRLPKA